MKPALSLCLLLGVAACASENLLPSQPELSPSFAKAALPKKQCDLDRPTMWANTAHYPHGGSGLRVTPMNQLRILNESMSDVFGACTDLGGARGFHIHVNPFQFAGTAGGPNPQLDILVRGNNDGIARIEVRRMSNGTIRGFMDYTDDTCMDMVTTRRNGEVVRTSVGTGKIRFPLPMTFRLTGWAIQPRLVQMTGTDEVGNLLEVSETPSNPASCHTLPHWDGLLLDWASGVSHACPNVASCESIRYEEITLEF